MGVGAPGEGRGGAGGDVSCDPQFEVNSIGLVILAQGPRPETTPFSRWRPLGQGFPPPAGTSTHLLKVSGWCRGSGLATQSPLCPSRPRRQVNVCKATSTNPGRSHRACPQNNQNTPLPREVPCLQGGTHPGYAIASGAQSPKSCFSSFGATSRPAYATGRELRVVGGGDEGVRTWGPAERA